MSTPLEDEQAADAVAFEAFIDEQVREALAPYVEHLPAEVLDEFEDDLRCFLLTHPSAYRMLARIRPHVRAVSGTNPAAPSVRAASRQGKVR
jgi:hypothetical protein